MNEHDTFEQQIDDALDNMPLVEVPSGLVSRIMAQLEPEFVPEPFRITRNDIMLAAGVSVVFFVGIVYLFSLLGLVNSGGISAETLNLTWLTPITALSILAVPFELLLAYALYEAFTEPRL